MTVTAKEPAGWGGSGGACLRPGPALRAAAGEAQVAAGGSPGMIAVAITHLASAEERKGQTRGTCEGPPSPQPMVLLQTGRKR